VSIWESYTDEAKSANFVRRVRSIGDDSDIDDDPGASEFQHDTDFEAIISDNEDDDEQFNMHRHTQASRPSHSADGRSSTNTSQKTKPSSRGY
jgi:hypothetical protein